MTLDELKAVGLDGMAYMIFSLDRRLKDMTQECILVNQQLTSLSTSHRTLLQERNEARAEVERLKALLEKKP